MPCMTVHAVLQLKAQIALYWIVGGWSLRSLRVMANVALCMAWSELLHLTFSVRLASKLQSCSNVYSKAIASKHRAAVHTAPAFCRHNLSTSVRTSSPSFACRLTSAHYKYSSGPR